MKNDRVAVILPRRESFSFDKAGAIALTVRDYIRASALAGHTTVYGSSVDRPLDGATFIAVKPRDAWFRRRNIAFAVGCAEAMENSPPLHIDVHGRVEIFQYLAKRFPRSRVCLHFHNDPLTTRGAKTTSQRTAILKQARFVFCVSDFLRRRFLEGIEQSAEKVVVLPNAIACEPEKALPKHPVILFVGRIIPEKGAHIFAEALERCMPKLPGWRAVIIGAENPGQAELASSFEKSVHAKVASLGGQVSYAGFIPHEQVMAAFRGADIAVVPSLWDEPFGRTALEAMASRCAVIATRRGGLPEVVGDAGILLDSPDSGSLAEAIAGLAENAEWRVRLQAKAQQRIVTQLNIATHAARLDALRVETAA